MKTFTAVNRTSPKLRKLIQKTLEIHEKYKSSYFWNPAANASSRRQNEKNFPINEYAIETKDGILKVRPHYKESCSHCYYSLDIYLESPLFNEPSRVVLKKKNIRSLKQLIKETK